MFLSAHLPVAFTHALLAHNNRFTTLPGKLFPRIPSGRSRVEPCELFRDNTGKTRVHVLCANRNLILILLVSHHQGIV